MRRRLTGEVPAMFRRTRHAADPTLLPNPLRDPVRTPSTHLSENL